MRDFLELLFPAIQLTMSIYGVILLLTGIPAFALIRRIPWPGKGLLIQDLISMWLMVLGIGGCFFSCIRELLPEWGWSLLALWVIGSDFYLTLFSTRWEALNNELLQEHFSDREIRYDPVLPLLLAAPGYLAVANVGAGWFFSLL